MKERIEKLFEKIQNAHFQSLSELEEFRIEYLGKKGHLTELFDLFKAIPAEEKKEIGQLINKLKDLAREIYTRWKEEYLATDSAKNTFESDLTRPALLIEPGALHPLNIVRGEIIAIFNKLGYDVSEGPEIEDDWYNFSALNFPPEHPAREMQDTFFIDNDPDIALRTHTSSVQVRVMETSKPPIRTVSPGRVYRNEAISARSHCFFHQVEGLYIEKNVSIAHLKHDLYFFAREMFGAGTKIRLRPSYFPFTEPSAEMDVTCNICGGKGCNICKNSGWLEIMGCGMVDPNVLDNCGIDPEVYSGFAFGMGIDRIAMLKYQIKDIRLFSENDVRFLNQFVSE